MNEVIYLTGAPATGKSTLSAQLKLRCPTLRVFEYGKLLTGRLNSNAATAIDQEALRRHSSAVITESLVRELDNWMLDQVDKFRAEGPVLIDSHAVTLEKYGFRVIPFSADYLKRLQLTRICCLFTSAKECIERIQKNPGGRPLPSDERIHMHINIQMEIASVYSVLTGCPLYLFDSSHISEVSAMEKILSWIG